MKVRLLDAELPPACQPRAVDPKNRKKWEKVRGMIITCESERPITSLWPCGTDTIFRITSPEYFELVGADENDQLFVCKHQIAEVIL